MVGDFQTALNDCNEALQLRPGYADALDSRGFVKLKIGLPDSDIAAAKALDPIIAAEFDRDGIR